MADLHDLSAVELLDLYRRKAASPVEVVRDVLRHIERWEPRLCATWSLDPDGAFAQAEAAQARWLKGAPQGALDGVPVTIKENIATRGVPVPLGTAATVLVPAERDAPPAARLREAGAVILGKTTMPDYGMLSSGLSSFHKLARNPWDLTKNPGGSSAGAAAAAAAGYGPLHLGTDIGGSVRLPAGWCGIATLKPSLGRIPIYPPYAGRVAGPMTRAVADTALMMGVLSQPDARDTMSLPYQAIDWDRLDRDVKGLKIGLLMDAGWGAAVEPEVRAAVEAAARAFEAAGAIVTPMKPFMARSVADGMDRFWRCRAWMDISALAGRTAREDPAVHPRMGARRRRAERRAGLRRLQPDGRDARGRGRGVCAVRRRALADLADARLRGRAARPDQRPGAAVRAHRVHAALQHERAARGERELRLHVDRPADRAADHRPPLRRPRRAADRPRLGADAAGAAPLAHVMTARRRAGTRADPPRGCGPAWGGPALGPHAA